MKLPKKGLKLLRTLHILTISVWFGGVVCIGALIWICFFGSDEGGFLSAAHLVPRLHAAVILPAGILTILEGVVYGCFSGWGFFRHKWIMLKWLAVPLVGLCTGMGAIGQMFAAIEKVQARGCGGGFADGGAVIIFNSTQIMLLGLMVCISVYKPFGKKKEAKAQSI